MPSDHAPASADASATGTPYRALLAEGASLAQDASFDVTLGAEEGVLTLQAVHDADEDAKTEDAAPAPPEEIPYRFESIGEGHALLVANGRSVPVVVSEAEGGAVRVTIGGRTATVHVQDETDLLLERFGIAAGAGADEAEVRAPMPGLIVRVLVEEDQEVDAGDGLLVLEAMKMENELRAPVAGLVTALHGREGASVSKGEVLVEIQAA